MQLFALRPRKENIPEPNPGWDLTLCPYCQSECWRQAVEATLPAAVVGCCTECGIERASKAAMNR